MYDKPLEWKQSIMIGRTKFSVPENYRDVNPLHILSYNEGKIRSRLPKLRKMQTLSGFEPATSGINLLAHDRLVR